MRATSLSRIHAHMSLVLAAFRRLQNGLCSSHGLSYLTPHSLVPCEVGRDQGEMFHPAAAAACGVLLNQGWVGSPEIMVTSHMGFDLRASPPVPLLGSPRFAGGGVAASHPRGNLLPCPTKHGDGNHPAQLGASSSSNVWPWPEEDALNEKELLAGNKKKRKKKNSTVFNENMVSNLSIGATRKKKLKVRKKLREPRFCFQTQSDVDVLDDGYKWRKYGQKVVKDTQHPRSYYRCTQRDCRVKKRIERLAEDPRMVITTYEGRHAHSPSPHEESSQASSKLNLFWQ